MDSNVDQAETEFCGKKAMQDDHNPLLLHKIKLAAC